MPLFEKLRASSPTGVARFEPAVHSDRRQMVNPTQAFGVQP